MKPLSTWEKKVGDHRHGPHSRIWIEGPRLTEAGFTRGSTFVVERSHGRLVLMTCAQDQEQARTVSGKGDHPIIDISGKFVSDTLGTPRMCCKFYPGRIVITPLFE